VGTPSIGERVFGVKLVALDSPSFDLYFRFMQQGQASVTALGAAGHRAAHQILERGLVFTDPLALRILGQDAADAIALAKQRPERRPLRLFIAMRSRFAEDSARRAIADGVRQILVMGAGLDTFAYRLEQTQDMRVFELDHPATQAEKRRRLTEAQISAPAHVSYVAHDFEGGSMTAALKAAGFDPDRGAFVLWLGVTPYLTEEAVLATLGELASWPGGTEVVFDYANPPEAVDEPNARNFHREMAERVAASGEPFRCYFDTPELHARARELGFAEIEDLDRSALVARYLPDVSVAPRPGPGGHVVRMATA
jgi:methyltransferase (TIGR00027 family)